MKHYSTIAAAAWLVGMAGSAAAADAYDMQGTPDPYVQSGLYFRGDVGKSWFEGDDGKADMLTFGAGVGFEWSPMFRTDVRLDYGIEYGGDVGSADKLGTVTANGYVDIPLGFSITPYVGAGIGYYGFVSTDFADKNGLAAALMGGLTFDVSKFVAIDLGYRFRTIATDGGIFATDNARDHSVTTGLQLRF